MDIWETMKILNVSEKTLRDWYGGRRSISLRQAVNRASFLPMWLPLSILSGHPAKSLSLPTSAGLATPPDKRRTFPEVA